ncbi:hypothetical protein [Veillonella sp. DNF00869]|uniref:hypothetical protein n=1 Tax=Veillonella sp. DNF00869 TaxID=1384081 RepID=UPI000780CFC5|nr:hypothetical protein [Veillonella sp. DNF00869]KXB89569.1 hypothetical protein HMPREF3032_00224 [Veillonella sp. DNF00869]
MKRKYYMIALLVSALTASLSPSTVDAKQGHDINVAIKTTINPALEKQPQENPNSISNRVKDIVSPKSMTIGTIPKGNLYIPKDTPITLELTQPISSKKSKKNTSFVLRTVDNLILNGTIIIPKGEEVRGKVIDSHGNGMFGRGGRLIIDIPSIKTLNNVTIPLNGYVNGYGSDDTGAVAVTAVVSLVGGFFMRGENIYYEPGQLFTVTVQKDTDLEVTPETLAQAMDQNKVRGQSLEVKVAN